MARTLEKLPDPTAKMDSPNQFIQVETPIYIIPR
jgi:hypothetical protein